MTPEIILRHLNLIKNLYKQGQNQSLESETVAYTAALSMHDVTDMFMNPAAKANGLNKGLLMMQYFDQIQTLTLKESANKINKRRKRGENTCGK